MSDTFGGVEKDLFNRKEGQVVAKHAKLRQCISVLCELCVSLLRPLRLMDFNFFNTPIQTSFIRTLVQNVWAKAQTVMYSDPLAKANGKVIKAQNYPNSDYDTTI